MNFEETYLDKIICGDCLDVMRKMPDKCLDLVVTSPPYNLKNSTGNGMKENTKVENGQETHCKTDIVITVTIFQMTNTQNGNSTA